MKDAACVEFLQWALPRLRMRWAGFRKVRRQVCKRIDRRLQQLGLDSVAAYRDYLDRDPREWPVLDEMCRISISRFYRDRRVFDLLRDEVLVDLAASALARGDSSLRVWSIGCASGEEVYTLKTIWELGLQRRFPSLSLSITASDADSHMLHRAKEACYPSSSVKDFPKEWLSAAFATADNELRVREPFRTGIQFVLQDIRRQQPPGPFDLIMCRHLIFTYFDATLQEEVLKLITARLRCNGILVIGKQETLPASATANALQLVEPRSGIYRWLGS